MTAQAKELEPVTFAGRAGWSKWLAANHGTSSGVWLKLAKKRPGKVALDYPAALEEALSWGWIDGPKRGLDEAWWLQRFTPRRRRSIWSKINREKALALIAAGKMRPAGLAEVERAQQDGRWADAYDSPRTATVPEDLAAAFKASPRAGAFFATLNSANRYAVLWRLQTAQKPQTRARRLAKLVEMLDRGEKLHP